MSSSNKILDMFDVVMKSDMENEEKLKLVSSLTALHETTKKEEELAEAFEKETNPNSEEKATFKVTFKPRKTNGEKTVFGHRRWSTQEREGMFTVVKETFGPYSEWQGLVTPGVPSGDWDTAVEQIAEHYGRTPLAIKSQIRDAIQPCKYDKNEDSIRVGKEAAFAAGFIDEEQLNS